MKAFVLNVYRYSFVYSENEHLLFTGLPGSNILTRLVKRIQESAAFDCIIIVSPESDSEYISESLKNIPSDNILFYPVSGDSSFAFNKANVSFDSLKMFSFPLYGGWNIECLNAIEENGVKKILMLDAQDALSLNREDLQSLSRLIDKGRFSMMLENWSAWLIGSDIKNLKADVSLYDNQKLKRFKELYDSERGKKYSAELRALRVRTFVACLQRTFLVEKLKTTEEENFVHELRRIKKQLSEKDFRLSFRSTLSSSVYNKFIRDPKTSLIPLKEKITVPEIVRCRISTSVFNIKNFLQWYQAKIFYFENHLPVYDDSILAALRKIKQYSSGALIYWEDRFNKFTEFYSGDLLKSDADAFIFTFDEKDILLMADEKKCQEKDSLIISFAEQAISSHKKILFKLPLYEGQENLCVYIVNKWQFVITDFIIDNSSKSKGLYPTLKNLCSISPREVTVNSEKYNFDLCPVFKKIPGGVREWQKKQIQAGKYDECESCIFKQKYGNRREQSFFLKANTEYLKREKINSAKKAAEKKDFTEALAILESLLSSDPCNHDAWQIIGEIECCVQ